MSMRLLGRAAANAGTLARHEAVQPPAQVVAPREELRVEAHHHFSAPVEALIPLSPLSPDFTLSPAPFSGRNINVGDLFYDLVRDLTREYDRIRASNSDLSVENVSLRRELSRRATEVVSPKSPARSALRKASTNSNGRFSSGDKARPPPIEIPQAHSLELPLEGVPVVVASSKGGRSSPPTPAANGDKKELCMAEALVCAAPRPSCQEHLPQPLEPESPRPPPLDSPRDDGQDTFCSQWSSLQQPVRQGCGLGQLGQDNDDLVIKEDSRTMTRVSFTEVPLSKFQDSTTDEKKEVSGDEDRASFASVASSIDDNMLTNESGNSQKEMELLVLPVWLKKHKGVQKKRNSLEGHTSELSIPISAQFTRMQDEEEEQLSLFEEFMMRHIIMRPNSRFAVTWDFLTVVVLVWDLIVIPLQAFELPEHDVWGTMELAATITWTVDICLSFLKGYEVRGDVEMHPKAIARHYLRTWFAFDISIVSMDWFLYVVQSGDLVDWLRFSRFRRALRLLRIARLLKVGAKFLSTINYIQSEDSLVALRILWLLVILVAINHFISCGWYAIGTLNLFTEDWLSKTFDDHHGFWYRYTTSFHWSVTQFTPASMEVFPRNALERAYNIICIFFGLLMFSSFVSNMTSSMTYLTKLNYEKRHKRDQLMGYMNARNLSLQLRDDIVTFLSNTRTTRRRAWIEEDVASLKLLPQALLTRLHIEVHVPVLDRHALFQHFITMEQSTIWRICHRAMSERALQVGEELFRFGVRCSRMYFTVSGESKYVVGFGEEEPYLVGPQQWLCEAALWVEWEHRGQFNAKTVCEISQLDATEFATIICRSMCMPEVQRYARLYALHAERENNGAENMSDLWGQRLRAMDLFQKAFRPEDCGSDNAASKVINLWCGKQITEEEAFLAWKTWVRKEKRRRDWFGLAKWFPPWPLGWPWQSRTRTTARESDQVFHDSEDADEDMQDGTASKQV